MTTGTTTLLSLALPVEGELDGTWGDVVNYGITDYVDIAVAGTLTLNGDGAVTLANTAGDASGTNIGATTAQYAVIKITGTLTTTKVVTAPSYSKTYIVDNAATGGAVTFKASGQTGVSVAVGEKCTVYFNGTDYVKVASSVVDGVSTISFGSTGLTPSTATSGAVTVAGTLAVANGGTGVTTSTGTGNVVLSNSPTLVTPALGTPSSATLTNATGLPLTTGVTGTLPVANGGTGTTTPSLVAGTNISVTGTWPNQTINSTGGSVTSVTGSGNIASSGGSTPNISFTGILPVANGGTATATPTLVAGSNVTISGTWPNQTIAAVGGGGVTAGIYPAIAYGTLSNGVPVVINSDGTVSAVTTNFIGTGTAANFVASTAAYTAAVYDSTNNKVVVAYTLSGSSNQGYAVVGTVSGTSISFGTPVSFGGILTSDISIAFDSVNGKVVIAYANNSSSVGQAIVGTVSGTSISFGTEVTFQSSGVAQLTSSVYDVTDGVIVISYTYGGSGYSIVGTVSGTSISFGTRVLFSSNVGRDVAAIFVGSSKVVVTYCQNSSPYYAYAIVGTVSGTSISFGTAVLLYNSQTDELAITYDSANSKVVVALTGPANYYGRAFVGTVSGTSISFGSVQVFNSASTDTISIAYSNAAGKVLFCFNSGSASKAELGIVSGSSMTFSSSFITDATISTYASCLYDSTSQKFVNAYSYASNGKGIVLTAGTNLTATNFIGISDAAYSSGATATIQTVGSTDDAQSGLTAGLAYYVQTDGTLSTTAGSPSVFAGTAVSATKIIIKG